MISKHYIALIVVVSLSRQIYAMNTATTPPAT